MENNTIIKTESSQIVRVGNAISITNKILTLYLDEAKIFFANDHDIVIRAIQKLFDTKKDFKTVGRSYSFEETFEKIKDSGANILLTDDQMPKTDFVNDIHKIRKLYPDLKIIVHTMGASEIVLDKYINQINGFIDLCAQESHYYQILEKVKDGENYFVKADYSKDNNKERSFFVTDSKSEFLKFVKKNLEYY